jgi:hypothetical protein
MPAEVEEGPPATLEMRVQGEVEQVAKMATLVTLVQQTRVVVAVVGILLLEMAEEQVAPELSSSGIDLWL